MSNCITQDPKHKDVLADIINLSADIIISVDENHNVIFVNPAFEKIFGYQSKEIFGQSLNILLPKAIHSAHKEYIDSYDKSDDTSRHMAMRSALCGISKTGEEIPLDISIQKHPKGGLFRYTAICRDISSRVAQEKRLREEEKKFKTLFNSSFDYIILMNGQGEIVEFNDTAARNILNEDEKYTGEKIWDCGFWRSETDFSLVQKAVSEIKSNENTSIIINILAKNHRKIILEVTLKLINMEHQQIEMIVFEGKDITELVKSNRALIDSESRLARAQKISRLGNWEWDLITNEFIWSDEIYRIFGLDPRSFTLTYDAFLGRLRSEDRPRAEQALTNSLSDKTPYKTIYRIILPDGNERIVEDLGEIYRMEDENPIKIGGTIQDITESWGREREFVFAKMRTEDKNIAKV
ncbi:MAG: PAS domain S-box protein [Emcibacter sp.]|nr:PAS domain S-box protein [Emcibacter sp.]